MAKSSDVSYVLTVRPPSVVTYEGELIKQNDDGSVMFQHRRHGSSIREQTLFAREAVVHMRVGKGESTITVLEQQVPQRKLKDTLSSVKEDKGYAVGKNAEGDVIYANPKYCLVQAEIGRGENSRGAPKKNKDKKEKKKNKKSKG